VGELARWQELVPLFIAAVWCHGPASPFLPATFEPVVIAYGRTHTPALVALSAAVISVVMEGVNYLGYGYVLRSNRLGRLRTASAGLTSLFQRWPFLTCLLIAATPLPDWSARILGAMARYSTSRYLAAFLLGRMTSFWLLATIGQQLQPPRSVLVIAAVGSIVLTYGTVCLRRLWSARAGHAQGHDARTVQA
jgi:membrane protein YqaA with SNARE-associated domain